MPREVQSMVYAALFAALTAVGAFMSIPLPGGVPITLQVLFVLLAGALLGSRWGAVSMVVYLLLGAVGLPVFARGGSGIGAILGPTGGYLISYVPAAYVTGWLIEKRGGKTFSWNVPAMAVGLLIIYALGVAQLMNFNRWDLAKAIAVGAVPFILVDSLKVLAAACIAARVDLYK